MKALTIANTDILDQRGFCEIFTEMGGNNTSPVTKQTKTNISDETSNIYENETETETENSVPWEILYSVVRNRIPEKFSGKISVNFRIISAKILGLLVAMV